MVSRWRDRLQAMPWLSLIGYGLLMMFYGMLVSFLLPGSWQGPFKRMLILAPLLLIAAKDLASIPLAMHRVRDATARGEAWPRRLLATLPPEVFAYTRLERAMWRGFFSWMLRRPQRARPAGTSLGYLERGAYGTVLCCVLVSLFVEIPIDVLIAGVMAQSPAQARSLHVVFGLLALYGFVWVMGDRWYLLGRRHHVLTATTLELDIGARGHGSIPLEAIAGYERLTVSRAAWCKRHGWVLHATRTLSPCDAPNLVLTLKPGSDVRLTLLQMERGGDGPIFLYLDRPELLSAALTPPPGTIETT